MMKKMIRTYSELISLPTFSERFQYLRLSGEVGNETFGSRRWINQNFYHSPEWLRFRDRVIFRDGGCDLGVEGYEIFGSAIIHHINPITYDDIVNRDPCVFDLNNVISTTLMTHNAIHYGTEKQIQSMTPIDRTSNDTCPWKT